MGSFWTDVDRLSLSTKVGIFVTMWLAVYSLVTLLVFHNWDAVSSPGRDMNGAAAAQHGVAHSGLTHSLFDAVGSALSSSTTHAHMGEAITSYDYFLGRMDWLAPDIHPDAFLVTDPFLTDTCVARYGNMFSQARVATVAPDLPATPTSPAPVAGMKGSAAVVISFRNGKDTTEKNKQFLLRTIGSVYANSGSELKEVIIVVDEMDPHLLRLKDWGEWHSPFLTKLFGSLTPREDGFLVGSRRLVLRIVDWTNDYRPAYSTHKGSKDDAVYEMGWTGLGGTAWNNEGNMYNLALERIDESIKYVAFLSPTSMVSEGWLIPLLETSHKRPNAIVYPAIDVIDPGDTRLSPGAEAVAGFDWSFAAKWEPLVGEGASGVPTAAGFNIRDSTADPVLSPSLPSGAFLARRALLSDLGGFHPAVKDPERRAAELALRTWLCGGEIVRQPCSRVALAYSNLWSHSAVLGVGPPLVDPGVTFASAGPNGADHGGGLSSSVLTQGDVDVDTQQVAEAWLPASDREFSFRARFADRVAYKVDVPWDARAFMGTRRHMLGHGEEQKCSSFSWYKTHVYPGLSASEGDVTARFAQQVEDMEGHTRHKLAAVLKSYHITDTSGEAADTAGAALAARAQDTGGFNEQGPGADGVAGHAHAEQDFPEFTDDADHSGVSGGHNEARPLNPEHIAPAMHVPADMGANPLGNHADAHADAIAATVPHAAGGGAAAAGGDMGPVDTSSVIPPRAVQQQEHRQKTEGSPELKRFTELNRVVGYCRDYLAPGEDESECPAKAANGACEADPGYMLFACPKACGVCDGHGRLCTDFYLKMCPVWVKAGRCTKSTDIDWMSSNCKWSCGYCNQEKQAVAKTDAWVKREDWATSTNVSVEQRGKVFNMDEHADPYTVQRDYAAGRAPDLKSGQPACAIAGPVPPNIKKTYTVKWWPHHYKLMDTLVVPQGKVIGSGPPDETEDAAYADGGPPRVFCGIYTMKENTKPGGNAYMTRNAWAKRCTGFVAFSNHVDSAFPTINLHHDGPEEYNNMWQKSREIWKFIYRNYRDQFDFFVLGGDDMFYIMENLGGYLSTSEVRDQVSDGRGVFLGRRFYPAQPLVFNSGGAGYTLDRASLDALYNVLDKPVCFAHQHTFAEDVNVARCLRYSAIYPHDTRDETKAERFHAFQPGMALFYESPKGQTPKTDWYLRYNPELIRGPGCCSKESIAFHYIKANMMAYLYDYVYNCKARGVGKHH